jgi:hypothetical protein
MIENIVKNLEKNGVDFSAFPPATELAILQVEKELGLRFPGQVREFYLACDGLDIKTPAVSIFPVGQLVKADGELVFACFDSRHEVVLRSSRLNCANQWDIVTRGSGFVITHTMASFVANKLLAWVNRGRAVWGEETYDRQEPAPGPNSSPP